MLEVRPGLVGHPRAAALTASPPVQPIPFALRPGRSTSNRSWRTPGCRENSGFVGVAGPPEIGPARVSVMKRDLPVGKLVLSSESRP